MPLTWPAYHRLRNTSILFSGGLDSTAVAVLAARFTAGPVHLLTYKHGYGTLFNEWSRRHVPELQRLFGDRVQHHLIDLTHTWNEVGARDLFAEARKFGHWVCCLGCQESMAAHTIAYNLLHGVTNTFICSSVGGEYAVMSMPTTRAFNTRFYARYGVRYNAPLLDLGIRKPEERALLRQLGIDPGWGARRSHQGYQPICLLGLQHTLDVFLDAHTHYPPAEVERWLELKQRLLDHNIRRMVQEAGGDPDRLIEENRARHDAEQVDLDAADNAVPDLAGLTEARRG